MFDSVLVLICCLCFRAVNHPLYPSVLEALEIDDPVVANCLIDQRGVESILLIKVSGKLCLSVFERWNRSTFYI